MTESEVNQAVQYVTASTPCGREIVEEIIKTGLKELTDLAATSSLQVERETVLEYVCQWTINRTGYPELLVREILGCAGRWLDELYETIAREDPELLKGPGH